MIKPVFLLALTGLPANAMDFCGLSAPQVEALPTSLAGHWQATMRGGVLVAGGKPKALPADDQPQDATFLADGTSLTLKADTFFPDVTLQHFGTGPLAEPDLALPGESPLYAAELLQPQMTAAGLTCDPKVLPQFLAEMPMDAGASSTLRVYAMAPDLMVMVINAGGSGQSARAVFELRRAGKP